MQINNNNQKGNMTKEKRQTLNADKRKVIADVFQSHFEDNSKIQETTSRRNNKLQSNERTGKS